jgi:hypoxanthine-guanine phosphoribosyltransferase
MTPPPDSFGSFGDFTDVTGDAELVTTGTWTSELMDVSLIAHADSANDKWDTLTWKEQNTEDKSKAYVLVDILDSTGAVISGAGNIVATRNSEGFKQITFSDFPNAEAVDIKIRFKLFSVGGSDISPVIHNITLEGCDA